MIKIHCLKKVLKRDMPGMWRDRDPAPERLGLVIRSGLQLVVRGFLPNPLRILGSVSNTNNRLKFFYFFKWILCAVHAHEHVGAHMISSACCLPLLPSALRRGLLMNQKFAILASPSGQWAPWLCPLKTGLTRYSKYSHPSLQPSRYLNYEDSPQNNNNSLFKMITTYGYHWANQSLL